MHCQIARFIHQPLGGVQGQASDIAIEAEEILKRLRTVYMMKEQTGQSIKQIEKDADWDNTTAPCQRGVNR